MSSIKVRLELSVVGRTMYVKDEGMSNLHTFNKIKDILAFHFGSSAPIHSHNESVFLDDAVSYPSHYCAGHLIQENPTETSSVGKELIVLAHGDSMKAARDKMFSNINKLSWNELARDI